MNNETITLGILILIAVFQVLIFLKDSRNRDSIELLEREAARRAIDSWKFGDTERILHQAKTLNAIREVKETCENKS